MPIWPSDRRVLFCPAAGPRVGFGHLARCRALARALRVPFTAAVRGTASTVRAASDLGAVTLPAHPSTLDRHRPHLVVVDDPSQPHAAAWVAHARRRRIPVASIHDLGLALVDADLVIDGSVGAASGADGLRGPEFAILDPQLRDRRERPSVRVPDRVLIALGGGAHVLRFGGELAFGIVHAVPGVEIVVAAGFASGRKPALPAGGTWIHPRRGLASELSHCAAAVLAGGITLYESCALGTPSVAVAVTPAQRRTVREFAARGAVLDAGSVTSRRSVARVAAAVKALVAGGAGVVELTRRARALVDGAGAFRVAEQLAALAVSGQERPHAA